MNTSVRDASGVDQSRRRALKFGGLTVGFLWLGGSVGKALGAVAPTPGDATAAAVADGNPPFAPNAFIRIDLDGSVRLVMPFVEMGQSIYTGTAMLLSEELGVGLDQVRVEHAPPDDKLYGNAALGLQVTGGSTSTRVGWQGLREAGAVARTLLVSAAATQWKVDPASCTVERGQVIHSASGRQLGFGALASAAGKLPLPSAPVKLKDAKDFQLIGKPWRRVDAQIKVNGTAQFGIDVRVPGMKIATVQACPTFGGKLKAVDERPAHAIPGVLAVIKLDNAVAVVGEHFWAAKQGLAALDIAWDHGANATLDTAALEAALEESSRNGTPILGRKVGQDHGEGKLVEAAYHLPMLAHAPMEPMNTTVHVTADLCEVWVGTQVPARAAAAAAKMSGLPPEKVLLHNQYLGGGFGRRLETDSVEQAVLIAKQLSYPVKVIWTREEDIRHDLCRPMYYDRISANVDGQGMPTFWRDRITGGTVLGRWAPMGLTKEGLDGDAVECAANPPYALPNLYVDWVRHDMPEGLLVGWWRGVGPTHNLFVVESFIDELAHSAGQSPLAYRRALLKDNPRTLALLELAAEKIGWDKGPLPARVGRGIAVGEAFGSRVCVIAEVEVTPQGDVHLRRAVAALDCGMAVNPSSVESQIQGGLMFGFSAALFSGITVKQGAIEQSNFNDYRILRLNEAPKIELYRVDSSESPGGIGEVGTAIAAPALNNAIFAATGVRLRRLPIDRQALIQSEDAMHQVIASIDSNGTEITA
ncbi:MAG: xanthine dehydrogenase family protein molybdopterin-binding subunit [Dyella sp.]